MPYQMRKLPKQDLYRVYNSKTKEVHSYGTTLENAKKQIKLLNMIEAGVIEGGKIDRETTGVLRVELSNTAKNWLENKVLPLITQTTIRKSTSRKNSGEGRTQVFGYGNRRQSGFGEYSNNKEYPELWRALAIFGSKVVPNYIPWTAIQVNHNYKTKKHIDGNNIGLSLAVSFGDFTGGELVIGDKEYQTKLHPVIFNGALTEHFNRPIKGNRYSLVYFVSAPINSTDEQIYKIHNDLLENVKKMEKTMKGSGIELDKFLSDEIVTLPKFNEVDLTLPTYMYKENPNKKSKYRYVLVTPTTKERHLASRKNKGLSVDVKRKPVEKVIIKDTTPKEQIKITDFKPTDQAKIKAYYEEVKKNEGKNLDTIPDEKPMNKPRGFPFGKKQKATEKKKEKTTEQKPSGTDELLDILGDLEDIEDFDMDDYEKNIFGKGLTTSFNSGKNIKSNNSIRMNSWVQYVKDYAAKKGMKYNEALKDPECKAGYKKSSGVSAKKVKGSGVVDELDNQVVIATAENQKELGANAGKKYISL